MYAEQSVYISYSQIAVFLSELEEPFNDWTTQHVNQGFSWRLGAVSFRTLEEEGDVAVQVQKSKTYAGVTEGAIRVIKVPFEITGDLEVASITDGFIVELPEGRYSLYFETGTKVGHTWCLLSFVEEVCEEPKIILCDTKLQPEMPLLMEAFPAT